MEKGSEPRLSLQSLKKIVRLHASPSHSVKVDWCYLAVTAFKFALKTLLRITTLTEGEGKLQEQEKTSIL